jgi:hypothetical protein
MTIARTDVSFMSGGDRVAAWSYEPTHGSLDQTPCVVMAHGFSLTRHEQLI